MERMIWERGRMGRTASDKLDIKSVTRTTHRHTVIVLLIAATHGAGRIMANAASDSGRVTTSGRSSRSRTESFPGHCSQPLRHGHMRGKTWPTSACRYGCNF